MKLAESKAIGIFNDHQRGVADINTHLDHRGCHQNINFMPEKCTHGVFLGVGPELAVHQSDL